MYKLLVRTYIFTIEPRPVLRISGIAKRDIMTMEVTYKMQIVSFDELFLPNTHISTEIPIPRGQVDIYYVSMWSTDSD